MHLHTHRDLKKIASCRVKPFESVERNDEAALESKEVMLEDRLEDIENLLTELRTDKVRESNLKTAHSVYFSDMCTFTVEHPTLEH